jgi:hypothetical protein
METMSTSPDVRFADYNKYANGVSTRSAATRARIIGIQQESSKLFATESSGHIAEQTTP